MSNNLVSPGVQVTVVDQTAFTSSPAGTVPFILLATAENKTNQSNTLAQYTTANTAGQLYLETSQRSLVNDFGAPVFENIQGTPVNASEINEYGLMTAFATLGVSDAAYIMRAPIDLNALAGSTIAPTDNVPNGTLWFDIVDTQWGIFRYNAASQTFSPILPTNASGSYKLWVISNASQVSPTVVGTNTFLQPSPAIGKPGDYAVVPLDAANPVWHLNLAGVWVLVGSEPWKSSTPAVIGTAVLTNASSITGNLILNSTNVAVTSANLITIVNNINSAAIAGVGAIIAGSRVAITANSTAVNSAVVIGAGSDVSALTGMGLVAGTYYAPAYQASSYAGVPVWHQGAAYPAPTGSIWFNTTPQQGGANLAVKAYNATTNVWTLQNVTVAANDAASIYALDAVGGGLNIPNGTLYLEANAYPNVFATNNFFNTLLLERVNYGQPSIVTGTSIAPGTFATGSTITINTSAPSTATFTGNVTINVSATGTTVTSLINAINSQSISGILAGQNTDNTVYIENRNGGTFYLYEDSHTALANVGINVSAISNKVSNWVSPKGSDSTYVGGPAYYVSATAPATDPAEGTLWYYDNPTQADILINTGTAWASYKTVPATLEARGYNLKLTDPNGPIVSASQPSYQSTGNALVAGDLWVNTSDINALPNIWRYNSSNQWIQIDTTDHTSSNGIIFADARWSSYGNVIDPGSGVLDAISNLVIANSGTSLAPYATLDSDAPLAVLYPVGTLLFNTRRSGMNVKQFHTSYFSTGTFLDTWVTVSGNDVNGVAYQGSAAQRNIVVESLKSAILNSSQLLDEFYNFNLMVCPGYPELLSTLAVLNQNRGETAFIISDSPLTLVANANTLNTWANNLNGAVTDGVDGLVTTYDYAATYYPAGYAIDLSGNNIVVPSSFMTLPTIIQSDAISYPWFAPAGPTRGQVNNVTSLGYVDEVTGEFVTNSISKALRDVLYPASVNPISNFVTGGIEIYGQKTRSTQSTELSRINVARLVVYLRSALTSIGRQFVFEQNDSITRHNIAYQIGAFLKGIQAQRGLTDFAVVCDLTNNSPATIDANELYVDVAIAPTTSAEFIYIPVTLVGQGVLNGSSVTSA